MAALGLRDHRGERVGIGGVCDRRAYQPRRRAGYDLQVHLGPHRIRESRVVGAVHVRDRPSVGGKPPDRRHPDAERRAGEERHRRHRASSQVSRRQFEARGSFVEEALAVGGGGAGGITEYAVGAHVTAPPWAQMSRTRPNVQVAERRVDEQALGRLLANRQRPGELGVLATRRVARRRREDDVGCSVIT
jgi:hypothetical protein